MFYKVKKNYYIFNPLALPIRGINPSSVKLQKMLTTHLKIKFLDILTFVLENKSSTLIQEVLTSASQELNGKKPLDNQSNGIIGDLFKLNIKNKLLEIISFNVKRDREDEKGEKIDAVTSVKFSVFENLIEEDLKLGKSSSGKQRELRLKDTILLKYILQFTFGEMTKGVLLAPVSNSNNSVMLSFLKAYLIVSKI